ncbi:hypothetical protein Tco_0866396 [Tanacetum coccineum]
MTTSVVTNSIFRGFFEKQKLTGPNFIDWYRQLRIVLSVEDKLDYLEQPIPPTPVPTQAGQQVAPEDLAAHGAWVKGSKKIELKTLFTQQAEQELLQTVRDFHSYKQEEGHIRKTVNKLYAMLKLHEQTLTKKDPTLHGLRGSRKLKPGALSLYVGNGQRAAVEAIGTYHLCLPSGLVIILNNCHYAPSITRGIILVSKLYEDGYVSRFVDNTIQVSRNNMVYLSAVPRDGIFEIDLSNPNAIDSSMYAVRTKEPS